MGKIEKASPNDAEEILSVINASNREAYKDVIPQDHFREPVLSSQRLLECFEEMNFYVYKIEGKIVGVAALKIESEQDGRIHWVYIRPEHQREGIGTALFTFLEKRAKEMGLTKLRVLVIEKASWAIDFYKKLDYNISERVKSHWGFDVFMEKGLP